MQTKHVPVFAACLCLLLTACMGSTNPETKAPSPAINAEPAPIKTETDFESPETTAMSPGTTSTEKPALPAPKPERLNGLTPAEVQAIMGEPSFVRRDENMQTMLFEANACVFEIVFIEPSQGEHFYARSIEARTLSGEVTDKSTCLMKQLPNGTWLDIAPKN